MHTAEGKKERKERKQQQQNKEMEKEIMCWS
jgi:hypothetical protein